jgi:hypothetical protein
MGHATKKTPYFDIDINSDSKNILVIQKWKYEWLANGFSEWTYPQKEDYHKKFEKDDVVVICLSGRGDKDMDTYLKFLSDVR